MTRWISQNISNEGYLTHSLSCKGPLKRPENRGRAAALFELNIAQARRFDADAKIKFRANPRNSFST